MNWLKKFFSKKHYCNYSGEEIIENGTKYIKCKDCDNKKPDPSSYVIPVLTKRYWHQEGAPHKRNDERYLSKDDSSVSFFNEHSHSSSDWSSNSDYSNSSDNSFSDFGGFDGGSTDGGGASGDW